MNVNVERLVAGAVKDTSGQWIHVRDAEALVVATVRQCAELTVDYKNDDHYNGWLDYRDVVKQHFGVE